MSRNRYDRKASRRDEAKQRQAAYDALSLEEKIDLTFTRRDDSTREFRRLMALKQKKNNG